MAKVTWVALIVNLLADLLLTVAGARLTYGSSPEAALLLMVAQVPHTLVHIALSVLWLGVCTSLAALPTWVGIRRLARTCVVLAAVSFIEPFVVQIVFATLARRATYDSPFAHYSVFFGLFGLALHAVLQLSVAIAIDRAAALDRSHAERLVPWALLTVVLQHGALVSSTATSLLQIVSPPLVGLPFVIGAVLNVACTLGYTRVLRRASVAIGTQTSPEGHRPS